MFCKNCGKQIADDSKFCLYCGTKLFDEGAPEQKESWASSGQPEPASYDEPRQEAPKSFNSMRSEGREKASQQEQVYSEEYLKKEYARIQYAKAKNNLSNKKKTERKEKRAQRKEDFRSFVKEQKQASKEFTNDMLNGNISYKNEDMPGSKMLQKFNEFDRQPNRVKKKNKSLLILAGALLAWFIYRLIAIKIGG